MAEGEGLGDGKGSGRILARTRAFKKKLKEGGAQTADMAKY